MALVRFKRGTTEKIGMTKIEDGSILIPTDKKQLYVDIGHNTRVKLVPEKLSEIDNDDNYIKGYILNELPSSGIENILYFIPNEEYYYEYIYKNNKWYQVGSDIEIDESYDPTSANAQSGTAVAEAVADFITKSVNDLANYYLKSETYTQAEVNSLIGAISTISIEVVQTLPTQDIQTNVIYLVPKSSSQTQNVYDEYIYVNNAWEKIGDTQIDLSGYATKVSGATNGNFAGLDSSGNITDSGKSAADFVVPTDLSVYQTIANLVTTISSLSTDTEYPSAKCVYDLVNDAIGYAESDLDTINDSLEALL